MGVSNFLPTSQELKNLKLLGTKVCTMSDEEYYEEEEVTSQTSKKGEGFLKAKKQKGELDEQLREYSNEWRKQRGKEEEEEEGRRKEEAEKKAKEAEEKKKRLEEAEMKRQ